MAGADSHKRFQEKHVLPAELGGMGGCADEGVGVPRKGGAGQQLNPHKIMESFTLEETSKIIPTQPNPSSTAHPAQGWPELSAFPIYTEFQEFSPKPQAQSHLNPEEPQLPPQTHPQG